MAREKHSLYVLVCLPQPADLHSTCMGFTPIPWDHKACPRKERRADAAFDLMDDDHRISEPFLVPNHEHMVNVPAIPVQTVRAWLMNRGRQLS